MKTTTRLYDIIYTTYNNLYGDFLRGHQINYFNPEMQFSHKVIDYDDEIKTVCRNTIFYGLDFLDDSVRERFESEFLARFLTRTIKFQTYEVLNWRLASFTRGIKDIITDYYMNADKYLKGNTVSTAHNEDENTSQSTSRTNNIDVNLPQDNTDLSLDKDTFDYADTTTHAKSKSNDISNGTSNSMNETNNFDITRLTELQLYHDDLFNDLDRQFFSQML